MESGPIGMTFLTLLQPDGSSFRPFGAGLFEKPTGSTRQACYGPSRLRLGGGTARRVPRQLRTALPVGGCCLWWTGALDRRPGGVGRYEDAAAGHGPTGSRLESEGGAWLSGRFVACRHRWHHGWAGVYEEAGRRRTESAGSDELAGPLRSRRVAAVYLSLVDNRVTAGCRLCPAGQRQSPNT
jgi:hypothetical protein